MVLNFSKEENDKHLDLNDYTNIKKNCKHTYRIYTDYQLIKRTKEYLTFYCQHCLNLVKVKIIYHER